MTFCTASNLQLCGLVQVGAGGTVKLSAHCGINEAGGRITASNLVLLGPGNFSLQVSLNSVNNLAACIPAILCFAERGAFNVAQVGATSRHPTGRRFTLGHDREHRSTPDLHRTRGPAGNVTVHAGGTGSITLNGAPGCPFPNGIDVLAKCVDLSGANGIGGAGSTPSTCMSRAEVRASVVGAHSVFVNNTEVQRTDASA